MPFAIRRLARLGPVVATVGALACAPSPTGGTHRALVLQVLGSTRLFRLRLAGQAGYEPCTVSEQPAGAIEPFRCAGARLGPEQLRRLTAVTDRLRADTSGSADLAWAEALIDLITLPDDPAATDRAIGRLTDVVERRPDDPAALNDLAVASAVHARQVDDPAFLFAALDAAEHAVARDSSDPALAFNARWLRAGLGLRLEAGHPALPPGPWTEELAAALEGATRPPGAPSPRDERLGELRHRFLTVLLPHAAETRLNRATWAADSSDLFGVAARYRSATGDDELDRLADWLRALPAGDPRLAGVVAFGPAVQALDDNRPVQADTLLRAALRRLGPPPCALCSWAAYYLGAAATAGNRHDEAARLLWAAGRAAARDRQPALAAQAHWALALSAARSGRLATSRAEYQRSRAGFESLGERRNAGTVGAQLAEVFALAGQEGAAIRVSYQSLRSLRDAPPDAFFHGRLASTTRRLREQGWGWAALAFGREDLANVSDARPDQLAEALTRLAEAETEVGLVDDARRHLTAAGAAIDRAPDREEADRMRANVLRGLVRAAGPDERLARLDSAIAFFDALGTSVEAVPLRVEKAARLLESGDTTAAARALRLAAVGSAARPAIASRLPGERDDGPGMLATARRRAFGLLARLRLAGGDTTAAFWLDQRASGTTPADSARLAGALRRGAVPLTVAYSEYDDAVLAWTLAGARVEVKTIVLPRPELTDLAERFENVVRRGRLLQTFVPVAREVYGRLVGPAVGNRPAGPLRVVANGVIGPMPLAAAVDPATGRFLVEERALAFGRSVVGPAGPGRGGPPSGPGVLLIGNPAFDRDAFPELPPLQGAAREVSELAALYPGARELAGPAATRSSLETGLEEARMVHFAGHARWVPNSEALSHLVLAPEPSDPGGALFGSDIARLDLRRVDLVVLSSCGPSHRPGAGANALVTAFLGAGARAVVSGLSPADDRTTADLMVTFHRALIGGADPASALREAQLALLRDSTVAPGAWAQFRVETR